VPFLNARFQGLDVFYRAGTGQYTANRGKNKRQVIMSALTRAALLSTATLAYYSLVGDDDQYKDQPDFVKDNNWIFPTPWGVPILIPIPFEVGLMFKALPEAIMAKLFSGEESLTTEGATYDIRTSQETGDTAERAFETTLEISPFAGQFYGPLLEAAVNYNSFSGREIVPKHKREGRESWEQKEHYTDIMAQYIGERFHLSPMRIQHAYEGYAGTMGMYLLSALDHGLRSEAIQGDKTQLSPALPWYEWPLIKRFSGDERGSAAKQDAYDIWRETGRLQGQLTEYRKNGESDKLRSYLETHKVLYSMRGQANSVAKIMSNFKKLGMKIRKADMPADWKRDELERLDERMYNILNRMVPPMEEKADLQYFRPGPVD
jgi:hypothetical protein